MNEQLSLSLYFPSGSDGKESACNAGDLGLIPGLGRSPGEGKGYPLQDSGLENPMNCIVRGVAKGQTRLSDLHSLLLLLTQKDPQAISNPHTPTAFQVSQIFITLLPLQFLCLPLS